MASKSQIIHEITNTGVIAIIRAAGSNELIDVVKALREGGVTCIEVTMTTPNALEVIGKARQYCGDSAFIGVGSVLDSETARAAMLAGAQYVVAPVTDFPTIEICKRYSVPIMPGALTPTEALRAHQAGADFVKIFPTSTLGAQYIKDLRGPLPQIKYVPTGGIDLNNCADFIKAGASALGMGSALVSKDALAKKDFGAIQKTAEEFLKRVKAAREA